MNHLDILTNLFPSNRYTPSHHEIEGATLSLVRNSGGKYLAVLATTQHPLLSRFHGELSPMQENLSLLLCPLDVANASVLRLLLKGLQPKLSGLSNSFGMGDRMGLATPGHVRALRTAGGGIFPMFTQQSVRENARAGRNPSIVLADATWGAFQEGWQDGFGADADHLKTTDDIDAFVTAGYTFFTIDPGEYVDNTAEIDESSEILRKLNTLPWDVLETFPMDYLKKYAGTSADLGDRKIAISEDAASRALVKIGGALAHVVRMYRHLAGKGNPFELEISVDETETPTSHTEHYIIASELKRLGVKWVSLAPRFCGRFEKGVDYIGDPKQLEADIAGHAALARKMGPYKLSLHSGSDKFAVYAILAEHTRGLFHIKTAGTSYLEALRVMAVAEPLFFREILTLARERFPQDRASYHISAMVDNVPAPQALKDDELPGLLDHPDARQVLHVTFGSVLTKLGDRLKTSIMAHEEAYYDGLVRHFTKHLNPLQTGNKAPKVKK
jgi:tagaturonate epimerase